MTAMYGVLAAMPMLWGYAGYVLVSHPGTEETGVSRRLQRIMARAAKRVGADLSTPDKLLV